MSFIGNNGFGQQRGVPACGFQHAQFNHNSTVMGSNGHGPANNKGGCRKGNGRCGKQRPAARNNNSNQGHKGRRAQRIQSWKQGQNQRAENCTGNQLHTYDQPQPKNQNQNPNGLRRTATAPARSNRRNSRRFSPIPVNNQGFLTGPRGRRAKTSPWDGDNVMRHALRIKRPGSRSIEDVFMIDTPPVVKQQPIWQEDADVAMQDAPPLLEEQPVYQYQFDLERHFQLAFEQLALERQQGRELLAQGVLEMQRLAASMLCHETTTVLK